MRALLILTCLGSVTACTVGADPAPPTDHPALSSLSQNDLDACAVTCDVLRVSACIGLEAEPLCEYEWLCEAICEDNPSELICIRESSSEEICCQNYYGCEDLVTPDCTYGC